MMHFVWQRRLRMQDRRTVSHSSGWPWPFEEEDDSFLVQKGMMEGSIDLTSWRGIWFKLERAWRMMKQQWGFRFTLCQALSRAPCLANQTYLSASEVMLFRSENRTREVWSRNDAFWWKVSNVLACAHQKWCQILICHQPPRRRRASHNEHWHLRLIVKMPFKKKGNTGQFKG